MRRADTSPMAISTVGRRGSVVAGCVLAASVLVSCTQTVAPHRTQHDARPPASSTASTTPSHASLVARCRAHAGAHARVVRFRGARSDSPYCGIVWTSDVIHDCAKHAYGAKVIAFLARHHCGTARRTLATVFHTHFAVNLSSVVTRFPGTVRNPLGAQFRFTQLASARGAGGIDDLLRDGHQIPGPIGKPPKTAVYGVYPLNTNVDILYGWYHQKPTAAYRTSLKLIEQDVAFTPATA